MQALILPSLKQQTKKCKMGYSEILIQFQLFLLSILNSWVIYV